MGVATFIFFLCGLRTNIAYEIIFFSLTVGFCLASAAYWELAELNIQRAQSLQIVSLIGPLAYVLKNFTALIIIDM